MLALLLISPVPDIIALWVPIRFKEKVTRNELRAEGQEKFNRKQRGKKKHVKTKKSK